MLTAYKLAGLADDDALAVARDKRDEALKRLETARIEFSDWDRAYRDQLMKLARKRFSKMHW